MEDRGFGRYAKGFGRELLSPGRAARTMLRAPLEGAASRRISALPRRELAEVVDAGQYTVEVAARGTRHDWSLGAAEQIVLQLLIQQRAVSSAFEIGTFNGGTTRLIAESLPEKGRVVTLDLPPAEFDRTQTPSNFSGDRVGVAYRDSPAVGKVTQIRCDSLGYDFSQHAGEFDLVLVDGAHDYTHGYSDTLAALEIVAPGGIVLWDDFEPYWHGLINGILDAVGDAPVGTLAGTAFGVLMVP